MDTEEVRFPGAGVRLRGTITWPGSGQAYPGVVLIGGSGPSDRHGGGFCDALRNHLATAGIAVLAYDKRGAGGSTGDWASATVADLAQDAAAALAVLRSHPRSAGGRVGVLGHSEGGWVALRLCAQPAAPPWLVLNSCPAVPFLESEAAALTIAGVDAGTARSVLEELAAAARAGLSCREGQRIIGASGNLGLSAALLADGFTLDEAAWSQLAAWADYDPHGDLQLLRAATLVVFGADDPLCPVEASLRHYRETAAQAGRLQRTMVFPGAGHRLQAAGGFVSGYLDLLSSWCLQPGPGAAGRDRP